MTTLASQRRALLLYLASLPEHLLEMAATHYARDSGQPPAVILSAVRNLTK